MSAGEKVSVSRLFRHTVATLAYRGGKAVRGAPEEFSAFRADPSTGVRTPGGILAHIGDLLDWALELANGGRAWKDSAPGTWREDVERFFAALERLDARLASGEPLACSEEKLFQGPIADALAHVGQVALLRRLAGASVKGENYFVADIAAGSVGDSQSPPVREFD